MNVRGGELELRRGIGNIASVISPEPYLSWRMPPRAPLLIAVTGHRDLHAQARSEIVDAVRKEFRDLLDHHPNTPLRVLCGMAQGADLLVAETALSLSEQFPGRISVLPLLACPPELYVETFHSLLPGAQPTDMDHEAVTLFNTLRKKCEPWQLAPSFDNSALPARDDHAAWSALLSNSDRRHRRYQDVGAAMALFGQMTFALWDGAASGQAGGTDEVAAWCLSMVPEDIYPRGLERLGGLSQTALLRIHTPRSTSAGFDGDTVVEWHWPIVGGDRPIAPDATSFSRELRKRIEAQWSLRRAGQEKHKFSAVVVSCVLEFGRTLVDGWYAWSNGVVWNTRRPQHLHESALHSFEHLNKGLRRYYSERGITDGLYKHFGKKLAGHVSQRLHALAALRTNVTAIIYPRIKGLRRWVVVIFITIGFAAFSGHHYAAHLHVKDGALHYQPAWLASFVVLTAVAWALGWIFHARHDEPRTLDLRAVAEALRVQIFWALGGLPDSVPASYRQRQRGEFQWIRAAVRGAALPYRDDAAVFLGLSHAEKLERLRAVRDCWIDAQRAFFLRRFREYRAYLLFTKWVGLALALCGWFAALFILVLQQTDPSLTHIAALALFLILGGVLIAFSEHRHFPELAFSYERMHRVYDDALHRFDCLLDQAGSAAAASRQAECIAHLQTLIRALGRESLDENADWLTLHRARPFETPVH